MENKAEICSKQCFTIKNIASKKYGHFLALLIFGVTCIFFGLCEKCITPKYIIYSKLDSYIPFIKEAVIPYVFWYIYIGASLVYLGLKSKADFYKLIIFLSAGMLIAMFIFVIFPNQQKLRPTIVSNDFCSKLIRYIYSKDTPTNVTPSIHVLNSIAVFACLIKSKPLKEKTVFNIISFIIMIIICASTVLIKQHSIIDVILGALIGFSLFNLIYELQFLKRIFTSYFSRALHILQEQF